MSVEHLNIPLIDNQLRYWKRFTEKHGINMVKYIKDAVDRAISMDMDQMDPKWKKFIDATVEQQQTILGLNFVDKDMRDFVRYQVLMEKLREEELSRLELPKDDTTPKV